MEKPHNSYSENLIIIEKFEAFMNYIYPVAQDISRRDGYAKQKFINLLFETVENIYKALKTNQQKAKLYEIDANLSSIRYYMRFFSSKPRKLISAHQQEVAEIRLSEVGKILNSWIKKNG